MISKETFVECMNNIKKQAEIDEEVTKALEKVCDGYIVYGADNLYHKSLLNVLEEVMEDNDDTIGWWLYEDVEKMIWSTGGDSWVVETPEQLYDYLMEMKNAI